MRRSPLPARRRKKAPPAAAAAPATAGTGVTQRSVVRRLAGARSLMQGSATFASSSVESVHGRSAVEHKMASSNATRRVLARGRSFGISWCRGADGEDCLVFPRRVAADGSRSSAVVVKSVDALCPDGGVAQVPTGVLEKMVHAAVCEPPPPPHASGDPHWAHSRRAARDAQKLLQRYMREMPPSGPGEPRELLAHAADVWGLVNALWGDETKAVAAASAATIAVGGQPRARTSRERREAVGLWLASLLQTQAQLAPKPNTSAGDKAALGAVLEALSVGAIDVALTKAQRFPRLAVLVARAGIHPTESRVDGLSGDVEHIMQLLAGRPPRSTERPGGFGAASVVVPWATPDWKRGFAMHLWYCFPKPADEAHALAESVLEFEALCGESACAPWYDERRDDRDPRSRALRTCTMWRLLRLHGGAARPNGALLPLTSVTAPDAISPNVLDVALPWHLWHALASLDASGAVFDAACGPGSGAMAPGAHAAYAAQLERSGLWHSALEVMLHLPVVDGAGAAVPHVREAALRELVRRSCPGTPNEWRRNVRGDGAQVSGAAGVALERFEARCDELVRRGCADRTWKIDAIATRARAEGAWRCELCAIVELLEARAAAPGGEARALCARAHGVVIERVLPLLDETAKARLFDRPAPASVDIDAMRAVLDRLSLHLAPHVRRSDRSSDEEGTAVLRSYLSCYGHGPDLDGGVVDRARANAVCAELAAWFATTRSAASATASAPRGVRGVLVAQHVLSTIVNALVKDATMDRMREINAAHSAGLPSDGEGIADNVSVTTLSGVTELWPRDCQTPFLSAAAAELMFRATRA